MNATAWRFVAAATLVSLVVSTAHSLILVAVSRSGKADFAARCDAQEMSKADNTNREPGWLGTVHRAMNLRPTIDYASHDDAVCTSLVCNLCVLVAYAQMLLCTRKIEFESLLRTELACSTFLGILSSAIGGALTVYAFYLTLHFEPCMLQSGAVSHQQQYTDDAVLRHDAPLKVLGYIQIGFSAILWLAVVGVAMAGDGGAAQ